jgi:glycosyltransferase involved in cell wall biosynthesis
MTTPKTTLRMLVVHSSAELYGSDRSLLDFVRHRGAGVEVTVALPETGILVRELENAGARVLVGEICKIQRGMLSPSGMAKTLLAAWRSVRFLGRARRDSGGYDLVYSNTVAILGGALCARLWGVPHVWHVREILAGSATLTGGFRQLVAKLSATVVCNSGQTLEWIRLKGGKDKYRVIWNGFDTPDVVVDRPAERARLGAGPRDVLFVLVGRINAWKGQTLLLQAFEKLVAGGDDGARLAIVGSAPAGQEHYERELQALVARSACAGRVALIPYHADIEPDWIAADVVAVPSTEPEPFGRVAIEAMGFGRPVIAAAHGGLVEIVVDGETGLLVAPRDAEALAAAMRRLMRDPDLRARMGAAGRARQLALFSVAGYASRLLEVMHETSARGR